MNKLILLVLSVVLISATGALALPKVVTDSGWGLVWSDEFNGTALDTTAWNYDTGAGQPNAEQEFYSAGCVTVSDGALHIWSKYNPNGVLNATDPAKAKYLSGRINTGDKKIFKYGYFEAAIQGPTGTGGKNGPGLWSAVWGLGNSINHGVAWPTCGEMELYEQRTCACVVGANAAQPVPAIAGDDEFISCCHYGVNGGASYHSCQHNYPKCLCDRFHTYGIFWDSTDVHYYFDDTLFWGPNIPSAQFTAPDINQAANEAAFHNPFFWIINVAVGGAYQGQNIDNTIFPTHMDLDYVRVYQAGGTKVANSDFSYHAPRASALVLVNPSTAQLKVYDLRGQLVADYSNKVRQMKAGDNVMKTISAMLSRGAYVVRLVDNGKSFSQNLVSMK